jgi:1-acyl-sn-glycerol-3-phosphate acyltransferase
MAAVKERISETVKYGLRQWTTSMGGPELEQRLKGSREPSEYGVDSFGFSLDYALDAIGPFLWLYKYYFRCETTGVENVPQGRVLLVSNHGGQLPLDGAMIGMAMLTEANPPRCIRSMVEKWVPTLPFVSTFFARLGQIVGTPENCRRLLERDEAILVFPEGLKGMSKLFHERYQLQDFGLGFMRLALQTNTPVVPVAVIGAEEQAPAFFHFKPLAKLLGFPVFPITPTIVPLPLPTKYRLRFGAPLTFEGRADDDDAELEKKVARVRGAIDAMLREGLRARGGIFW